MSVEEKLNKLAFRCYQEDNVLKTECTIAIDENNDYAVATIRTTDNRVLIIGVIDTQNEIAELNHIKSLKEEKEDEIMASGIAS